MMSFSTDFPVNYEVEPEKIAELFIKWVIASPHNNFESKDFESFREEGKSEIKECGVKLECLRIGESKTYIAFRITNEEGELTWVTSVVYLLNAGKDAWVNVRTYVESSIPCDKLPPAKKPRIVLDILNQVGGGYDGLLNLLKVSQNANYLDNDDIKTAASLIRGDSGCRLPIVYVSSGFSGEYIVDSNALSSDLAGMAHIVVEPNRAFSQRLRIDVSSMNVYGGTIGIYWPDSGGRKSFFIREDTPNSKSIKTAIVEDIRSSLLNRRPLSECTFEHAQEAWSRHKIDVLKSSGSHEIDEYIKMFNQESKAKDKRLEECEDKNETLRSKNETLISKLENSVGLDLHQNIMLEKGSEQEFFSGECREFILELIENHLKAAEGDGGKGRKNDILRSVLAATGKTESLDNIRKKIKATFRDYKKMDSKVKKNLKDLDFTMQDKGKHYKILYKDDGRYQFSLPKTSSDHRVGKNITSEIIKKLTR